MWLRDINIVKQQNGFHVILVINEKVYEINL